MAGRAVHFAGLPEIEQRRACNNCASSGSIDDTGCGHISARGGTCWKSVAKRVEQFTE
jgi:hypothetical protein